MATKKISELEAINVAEDNDVLVIVDTSESTTNKITKGNLLIGAGHTIEMTLNENYQIVLVLKNAAGTALSTQTIDLPNENAITNLAYNNGVLTITKQSGATSQINLTGLIEGLVTENDFNTFKEALQATLEAINEKDAEQDEAIAENYKVINKLNEKLENQQKVIDQLPQVTGQGTEVTLENTIEATFTKFDVEGNSTQETTEGNQLLSETINFSNELTDKLSTLRLVISLGEQEQLVYSNNSQVIGKVSFSFIPNNDYSKFVIKHNGSSQDIRINTNFNFVSGTTYYMILTITGNNPSIKGGFSFDEVMISTVKGDYEPYTGGIASPNPNYKQPIESAGDNENLCDGINQEYWLNTTTLIAGKLSGNTGLIIPVDGVSKYTISTKIVQTRYRVACIDTEISSDGSETAYNGQSQDNTNNSITIDTTGHNYLLVNATSLENIKIEKGTKATPYSPYGMGSINEKIQTRNWFDVSKISQLIKNGATTTGGITNIDNVITINKTNGQHGSYAMNYLMPIKSGKITVSFKALVSGTHSNTGILVALYNSTATIYATTAQTKYASSKDKWLDYNATFELNQEAIDGIHLDIQAANTGNVIQIKDIQVELGSTATTYISHKEQDYSIFVQQPFRSIGDVRDCFVKKSDGWYERHYIKEFIVSQNTTIYLQSINDYGIANFYIIFQDNYYDLSLRDKQLCNLFSKQTSSIASTETEGFLPTMNLASGLIGVYIRILSSRAKTVEEFKQWANTNNLKNYYILAEPLDLPCTEEQIQQLENLPSTYKDFTIIQSQDETPAYLEVSGIRDIDTMFDKVTNAIVSLGGNV